MLKEYIYEKAGRAHTTDKQIVYQCEVSVLPPTHLPVLISRLSQMPHTPVFLHLLRVILQQRLCEDPTGERG